MITLTLIDLILLIMATVSITVGVAALIFSWIFYKNSQELNQKTSDNLSKISEKISKIDDIVSNQFNKIFSKLLGRDVEYEGEIPISELTLIRKIKKKKKKKN